MLYIANSFSLNMLSSWRRDAAQAWTTDIVVAGMSNTDAKFLVARETELGNVASAVGHQETADLFSLFLETPIPMNRVSVTLTEEDGILVGQLNVRLPEGSISLDRWRKAGGHLDWLFVRMRGERPWSRDGVTPLRLGDMFEPLEGFGRW